MFVTVLLIFIGLACFSWVVLGIMKLLAAFENDGKEKQKENKPKEVKKTQPNVERTTAGSKKSNTQKMPPLNEHKVLTKPPKKFSSVLCYLFVFLAAIFLIFGLASFGDVFIVGYFFAFFLLAFLVFSSGAGESSHTYYNYDNEENSSYSDYDDDENFGRREDEGGIFDSHGNMINGKLREYYRNVRKTGIANTEYEQELKDGYRYCDDHEEYDDCHYGRDD